MSVSKFKRILWTLNEFVKASSNGISMNELSDKWANSSMNDEKEPCIPERTFHRLRRNVESIFGVEIECVKGIEPRYRVSSNDLGPGDSKLYDLILNKATKDEKSKSVREILGLILLGEDIPSGDMEAVKDIMHKLRSIPFDYGKQLITSVEAGDIQGADCAEWDEYYRGYVCLWNKADYNRTDLWVSIGIYDDRVLFYIVTGSQDSAYHAKVSELLDVDNGEMYRGDYWWYEPTDKSLFQLDFQTFPDMKEVKRHAELLIAKIAELPDDIQKPEA